MRLPDPPMCEMVMDACTAGRWTVTRFDGRSFGAAGRTTAYAGLVAVRGDIRIVIEWSCTVMCGRAGQWRRRYAEIAVRHPAHDPHDFRRPHPLRWLTGTGDESRRCTIGGAHTVARLLSRPDNALRAVVLERPSCDPALRQCTLDGGPVRI